MVVALYHFHRLGAYMVFTILLSQCHILIPSVLDDRLDLVHPKVVGKLHLFMHLNTFLKSQRGRIVVRLMFICIRNIGARLN